MFEAVRALLEENRLEVLAVAHALETHRTITGEDVTAIIDGVQGPFIDGSGYYTQEAADSLETYHAAVVEARERGEAELPPLPVIEGITGRLVEAVAVPAEATTEERSPQHAHEPSARDA